MRQCWPRTCTTAVLTFLTAGVVSLAAVSGPAHAVVSDDNVAVSSLPAPYSSWHVSVTPTATDGELTVNYDSPALGGEQVSNTVYLPTDYQPGVALPVLYYLHGTVLPELDLPIFGPTNGLFDQLHAASLVTVVGPNGGSLQTGLQNFEGQLDRAHFIVAAIDTGNPTICQTCLWINGRGDAVPNLPPLTAGVVPAETMLIKEFIPLIQALFHARTDRAGRGITGFSMGAGGAWIQFGRHPDLFGFVAPISGAFDILNDLPTRDGLVEAIGYLRDQGYGTSITETAQWERFDPAFLVNNLVGANAKIVVSAGDGCLSLTDLVAPTCESYPLMLNPDASAVETILTNDTDHFAVPELRKAGVNTTQIRVPGVHGANNATVYAHDIVPAANQAFATATAPSASFSYTCADSSFSVWGYSVSTGDTEASQFLTLGPARHDGHSFTVHGSGTVIVSTPSSFTAGAQYEVTIATSTGVHATSAIADPAGRVTVPLTLGSGGRTAVTITATQ